MYSGDYTNGGTKSNDQAEAFIQEWLWFGVLSEFLEQLYIDVDRFVCKLHGRSVLNTQCLPYVFTDWCRLTDKLVHTRQGPFGSFALFVFNTNAPLAMAQTRSVTGFPSLPTRVYWKQVWLILQFSSRTTMEIRRTSHKHIPSLNPRHANTPLFIIVVILDLGLQLRQFLGRRFCRSTSKGGVSFVGVSTLVG